MPRLDEKGKKRAHLDTTSHLRRVEKKGVLDMAKKKIMFVCQSCGAQRPRWEGRCTDCGAWNSFVEEQMTPASSGTSRGWSVGAGQSKLVRLDEEIEATKTPRISTHIGELDRVLGGGLVQGSFILVGGDPGIGKSTLLLQMCGGLAKSSESILYVSAEESVQQIGLRAQRLGVHSAQVQVTSESNLHQILDLAQKTQPKILIVDSIQTVFLDEIPSAPGSVAQVRECAAKLMGLAKGQGLAIFVIGHVTKEGTLAGPRVLEHMVDTVLSFEGDHHQHYRLLRALKNRFGATNELGVFEMASSGLKEVQHPTTFFIEEGQQARIGSALYTSMEGSRPMLCEVQALTADTPFSIPRRTSIGLDLNRVHMLCAVLDKYLDLELSRHDVFINVVGGLRLTEPTSDLAVAAALWSSKHFRPLPTSSIFFGELGLTGEVRPAIFVEERLREAVKLGFEQAFVPKIHAKQLQGSNLLKSLQLHWIESIQDLKRALELGRAAPVKKSPSPQSSGAGSKLKKVEPSSPPDPIF